MKSRYEVTLAGKKLSAVDKDLLILDVSYSGIEQQPQAVTVGSLDGYDVSSVFVEKQAVTVSFELHIYDIAKRNKACQNVINWAKNGGILRTNDRADQYLKVRCESYPVINSARGWTDPLTVVFVTEAIPYWRNDTKNTLTLTGKQTTGTLKVTGNAGKTAVAADITAKGTITSLQIVCGGTKMTFSKAATGFSLSTGQVLKITYTNDRYLSVKVGTTSFLKHLSADSSDRLLAACGSNNTIKVTANNSVTAAFQAEGLWL